MLLDDRILRVITFFALRFFIVVILAELWLTLHVYWGRLWGERLNRGVERSSDFQLGLVYVGIHILNVNRSDNDRKRFWKQGVCLRVVHWLRLSLLNRGSRHRLKVPVVLRSLLTDHTFGIVTFHCVLQQLLRFQRHFPRHKCRREFLVSYVRLLTLTNHYSRNSLNILVRLATLLCRLTCADLIASNPETTILQHFQLSVDRLLVYFHAGVHVFCDWPLSHGGRVARVTYWVPEKLFVSREGRWCYLMLLWELNGRVGHSALAHHFIVAWAWGNHTHVPSLQRHLGPWSLRRLIHVMIRIVSFGLNPFIGMITFVLCGWRYGPMLMGLSRRLLAVELLQGLPC